MVGKIGKQLVFYQRSLWYVEVTRLMRLIAISDHRKLGPVYQLQLGEQRTNIVQSFCSCQETNFNNCPLGLVLRAEVKGSRPDR